MIGSSIVIKGDVSGDEDLLVEGRIEGTIELRNNHVTIGKDGKLKAQIHGRSVTVEGEVEGDIHAEEQIVLRPTAKMKGNIVSPRVTLEDGASFKGGIDMDLASSQPRSAPSKFAGLQSKDRPAPPAKAGDADAATGAKSPEPESEG